MPLAQGLKAIEGTVATGLWKTMKSDVPKIEVAMEAQAQPKATGHLPSMSQVLNERKKEEKAHSKEEAQYKELKTAPINDCGGMSVSECALGLDETQLAHLIAKDKMARQAQLHEVDEAEQDPDLLALKKQEALAAAKNKEERKLNAILIANRELAKQNKQLSHSASPSPDHVTTPATQQKQQQQHVILSRSSSASKPHKQALDLPVNEATQGNPPGVKEHVPLTVTAPPPGVPDFNGDTAVVARIPHLGFGPSILDEQGVEQRGSFTVRKANPYGGIWFRVYGKMNHPIHCVLRGYRKLQDEFKGNTVYTGYKQEWTAKTSISTGIIPPGPPDNFDIMTCHDTLTGEVQHFRTFPDPSPGFFEDPRDDYFRDEYTS